MKEEWYSASAFKWTYRQVKWLLSWLPALRENDLDWPPGTKKSGYVDQVLPSIKRDILKLWRRVTPKSNRLYRAKWENERSILGHLENKLCKMGLDGMLIKSLYCYNESAEWLGKCINLPEKVVKQRAKLALDKLVETEKDNVRDYQRGLKA